MDIAINDLFTAMVRAKFEPGIAYALKTATIGPEQYVAAAEQCAALAILTRDEFGNTVSDAAKHVYDVLTDRAGKAWPKKETCWPCNSKLHVAGLHTVGANIGANRTRGDFDTEALCGCACLRKNGGK